MGLGTVCDINNEPRSITIKYICDLESHQSGTVSVYVSMGGLMWVCVGGLMWMCVGGLMWVCVGGLMWVCVGGLMWGVHGRVDVGVCMNCECVCVWEGGDVGVNVVFTHKMSYTDVSPPHPPPPLL